ncbi:S-layer homology domain-containing protein [Thermincola potens]|uniref:S-layer domain protein n=1 Tax=Thermincola potens (strain JR) TaxID=635013 RepID=D5XA70_THEPJ|nr:S-layer homology domain-containing protein [Thermincola potens]ADG83203.1 S-layer domain protein [Thermincola potens JR]
MKLLKRIFALGLIFIFVFSFAAGSYAFPSLSLMLNVPTETKPPALLPFADVSGHWGEPFIAEMYFRGIMNGYADNTFRPNNPVTKLEALVMMVKMLGFDPKDMGHSDNYLLNEIFKVPKWAVPYVDYAIDNDIVDYKEVQNMTLQQPLIRQEAAVMVIRSLGLARDAKKTGKELDFTDADAIDPEVKGFVALANEKGLINGNSKGAFLPTHPVSRAEVAAIMAKVFTTEISQKGYTITEGKLAQKKQSPEGTEISLYHPAADGREEQTLSLSSVPAIYKNKHWVGPDELAPEDYLRVICKDADGKTLIFVEPEPAQEQVAFEQLTLDNAPVKLQQLFEEIKTNEGFYAFRDDSDLYLLACRGEKTTGGYSIEINSIIPADEQQKILTVRYTNTDPVPGNFYTLPITYPYSLVKVKVKAMPEKVIFREQSTGLTTETPVQRL